MVQVRGPGYFGPLPPFVAGGSPVEREAGTLGPRGPKAWTTWGSMESRDGWANAGVTTYVPFCQKLVFTQYLVQCPFKVDQGLAVQTTCAEPCYMLDIMSGSKTATRRLPCGTLGGGLRGPQSQGKLTSPAKNALGSELLGS